MISSSFDKDLNSRALLKIIKKTAENEYAQLRDSFKNLDPQLRENKLKELAEKKITLQSHKEILKPYLLMQNENATTILKTLGYDLNSEICLPEFNTLSEFIIRVQKASPVESQAEVIVPTSVPLTDSLTDPLELKGQNLRETLGEKPPSPIKPPSEASIAKAENSSMGVEVKGGEPSAAKASGAERVSSAAEKLTVEERKARFQILKRLHKETEIFLYKNERDKKGFDAFTQKYGLGSYPDIFEFDDERLKELENDIFIWLVRSNYMSAEKAKNLYASAVAIQRRIDDFESVESNYALPSFQGSRTHEIVKQFNKYRESEIAKIKSRFNHVTLEKAVSESGIISDEIAKQLERDKEFLSGPHAMLGKFIDNCKYIGLVSRDNSQKTLLKSILVAVESEYAHIKDSFKDLKQTERDAKKAEVISQLKELDFCLLLSGELALGNLKLLGSDLKPDAFPKYHSLSELIAKLKGTM